MTKTNKLSFSAMMVACATVLAIVSMLVPIELPFGGSVTICCMLPIIITAFRLGVKWGVGCAFVFSVIQLLLGAKVVSSLFMPGESQMIWWKAVLICLLDYIIAYTVIGLFGGLFRRSNKISAGLVLSSLVALTARYIVHIISGYIFYGQWAEWFFSERGEFGTYVMSHISGEALSLFYSIIYNGLYMIPEIVITCIASAVLTVTLPKFIKPELG